MFFELLLLFNETISKCMDMFFSNSDYVSQTMMDMAAKCWELLR